MIGSLFNSKVDVERESRISDDMGGWVSAWAVIHKDLPCRINWSRGSERIMFSKDTWFRDAKIYCAVVDIQTKDRILYDSKAYEIANVSNPDNVNKYLIVEMKLVE